MDTFRGNFSAVDDQRDYDAGDDDTGREAPPTGIGTDERRMQVRAYKHWASQLEDRNFPLIDELEPEALLDFGPHSVLLDFTAGAKDPGISYIGDKLAAECGVVGNELDALSDVPPRSLLGRITDHYLQILSNQAPIGFEAEFVNQRGVTILYRGILLPYSTDDETIDFIYGVINWKELADQHTSDELLLQVDQALEQKPHSAPQEAGGDSMADRADGPGATAANDIDDGAHGAESVAAHVADEDFAAFGPLPADEDEDDVPFDYAAKFGLNYDDEDEDEEYENGGEDEEDGSGLPGPSFGSLTSIGGIRKTERTAVLEVPEGERGISEIEINLEAAQADFGAAGDEGYSAPQESYALPEEDFAESKRNAAVAETNFPEPQQEDAPPETSFAEPHEPELDRARPEADIVEINPPGTPHADAPAVLNTRPAHPEREHGDAEPKQPDAEPAPAEPEQDHFPQGATPLADEPEHPAVDSVPADEPEHGAEDHATPIPAPAPAEAPAVASLSLEQSGLEQGDRELGDWLAAAREMAAAARTSEDRTRNALYEAIGRAYDFSLAAAEKPADFEELVDEAGLTAQDRAPMTPVVKLVFGADYDKTRLTEYAAALSHAHRLELPRGGLGDYLRDVEGGLKGVVAAERRMRKVESGQDAVDPREELVEKLRAIPGGGLEDLDPSGAEFALVMIRRDANGGLVVLGEVAEDAALLERAAKKLLG